MYERVNRTREELGEARGFGAEVRQGAQGDDAVRMVAEDVVFLRR